MAISTYEELKQEIIDWSHRGDIDLKVDTFIRMAETAMFSNEIEVLKVRGQEVRSTSTTSGQYLALPDDYLSIRGIRLLIPDNDTDVLYRAPTQMDRESGTGRPLYFTVTSQIEFNRIPDMDYDIEIHYYAKPAPLSSTVATNEVLDTEPNIYLFGALAAVFLWAVDELEAQKYTSLFNSAIKGANKKFKKGRYGPAPSLSIKGDTP